MNNEWKHTSKTKNEIEMSENNKTKQKQANQIKYNKQNKNNKRKIKTRQ